MLQPFLLHNAEALLFIDDYQTEIGEHDVFLQQAMRADNDVDAPFGQLAQYLALRLLALEARELFDPDREAGEAARERAVMLCREQCGRHEQCHLFFVGNRFKRGADRDFGLSVADVAADQAVHRTRAFHVGFRLVDRLALIGRFFIRKGLFEFGLPRRVGCECVPARHLALGVERD